MSRYLPRWPLLALALLTLPPHPSSAQDSAAALEAAARRVLDRHYEHKMISSGNNFPTVSVQREHRGDLCLLLHAGIPLDVAKRLFEWSDEDLQARLNELVEAGLVRLDPDHGYIPTLMVLTVGDVERYLPIFDGLVQETARRIAMRTPQLQRLYREAPGLARVPFERASLLILSNVLLDNWQINAVEREFLQAERPLRNGSRYYYSLQEDVAWDSTEAFGIYGNQYRGYGSISVGVYGNRRPNNPLNFASMDADALARVFGERPDTVRAFKQELLAQFVRAVEDPDATMPARVQAGFEAIGWLEDGRPVVPVLRAADRETLDMMAQGFTDELVGLLDIYRPALETAWRESPYGREVTFEEYFLWWYHLYYTAVTNRLEAMGLLSVPSSGITSYVQVSD